ncbi:MAG: GNAT family N-acetyltransferase [Rhodobacteraceae bacterium]|nr:MAG: GNAT family N-acetyltransferase [Paracoccaceae bacterium]
MEIRPVQPADLAEACALHMANWRQDYAEDLGAQALGAAVETRMAAYWAQVPEGHMALVARGQGDVFLGFIRIDPGHEEGPYVDSLHVMPAARSRGVGAALMAAGAARLLAAGHDRLWLKVMDRNLRGRAFYRRLGGVESAAFDDALLGRTVRARAFRWDGLGALAAG